MTVTIPATPPTDVRRARRLLLLIAAIFLAPVAVSFGLYYGAGWRPGGQVNHGELIAPARALPEVALPQPDGTLLPAELFRGKWTLIYVGDGACDAACRQALYTIRQVRLALAEKMDRVQRVFLLHGPCCDETYFAREQLGLVRARLDAPQAADFGEQFSAQNLGVSPAGRIFVVDPLGNLMMSYPPQAPAKGMIEDLKRLLKLSHVG